MLSNLEPAEQLADVEARIAEILFQIRRGEATDVTELLVELSELRRTQAALDTRSPEEHPELLLG